MQSLGTHWLSIFKDLQENGPKLVKEGGPFFSLHPVVIKESYYIGNTVFWSCRSFFKPKWPLDQKCCGRIRRIFIFKKKENCYQIKNPWDPKNIQMNIDYVSLMCDLCRHALLEWISGM